METSNENDIRYEPGVVEPGQIWKKKEILNTNGEVVSLFWLVIDTLGKHFIKLDGQWEYFGEYVKVVCLETKEQYWHKIYPENASKNELIS